MKAFFCAAILACSLAPLIASADVVTAAHRDFPIHYDGPMVVHAHQPVTGDLPNFNVTFHGGPVQIETTSYAVYWQPHGSFMSEHYKTLIDRFLKDAGGSAIYGMATTYVGSNGRVRNRSHFGGSAIDRTPYPSGGITDKDLQVTVRRAASAHNWKPGVNTQFFIFTGKGALKSVQYCAYHSAFSFGGAPAQPYVYGFIPYVGNVNGCNVPFGITPNNDPDSDGSILNMSHEQMEMVTDPLLNAWYDDRNGEIGDICIYSFGVPFSRTGGNIVIGNDPYFLQEDYSQAAGSCQPNL